MDVEDFYGRLRLKEYFHGRESSLYVSDPNPFKNKSTWTLNKDRDLGLELFIQLLKNDILNSKPSTIAGNISKSEREALQTLINCTDIVIKPADKGKATVVLNTDNYKKECYHQLNDSKFYRKLQKDTTHHIEKPIKHRLKDMMIDNEIDEETCNYSLPCRSHPARFYILPKIHKDKDNPPGRPIVSATSQPTEQISQFVDAHLNPLVAKLPSYIKDTTHFLRKLDDLKELPPLSLMVTLDISSLYTNIPHKEVIEVCRKAPNSSGHLSRSHLKTESICDLMHMILTMNNFEFNKNHFIQLHGTAMGMRIALLMLTSLWVT